MQIESLENRQFLSATLAPVTGALTVTGTTGNDTIVISRVRTSLVVTETSRTGNQTTAKRTTFKFADVKSITVDALAGNDRVLIGPGIAINATINGGDGNDVISSGAGADTINGDNGNDLINAGAGNDTVNGGAGRDLIIGGLGDDMLNGDAGNDLFLAFRAGKDTINGGANDAPVKGRPGDVALVDASDVVSGVERVVKLPASVSAQVAAGIEAGLKVGFPA